MPGNVGNRLQAHGAVAHEVRVLIVDDEMLIRWALGQALGARGCVVAEAATAREARAALRTSEFDVVVLDYHLPDTAHLDLLRDIRALAPSSHVLMMTAFCAPEMVAEAMDLGVSRVLEKPIDLDVAVGAILSISDNSREARMKAILGVWIDHEKAVVADAREDDIQTRTVRSNVRAHPHWGGAQDGGGEKKYEERHTQELNRFFDDVIAQLDPAASLYVFGPGEAKLELRKRLSDVKRFAHVRVRVEASDKLTDAQIVAKIKELAAAPGLL